MKADYISILHEAALKSGQLNLGGIYWRRGYVSTVHLFFEKRNVVELPTLHLIHKRQSITNMDRSEVNMYPIGEYGEEFLGCICNKLKSN